MEARLEQNNLSGNEANHYTVLKMRGMIERSKSNMPIKAVLKTVLCGIDGRESLKIIKTVYDWIFQNIRYQKDPHGFEEIKMPHVTVALGYGDCDDFSILLSSMLENAGFPTRLVMVSARPDGIFHHIFIQVFDGSQWISLDPTEQYFGTGYINGDFQYFVEKKGTGNQNILSGIEKNKRYERIR